MKTSLLFAAVLLAPLCSRADCQLISSQQKVTYGHVSASVRQQTGTGYISLPEKQLQIQVICSEPQRIRLLLGSSLSQKGTFALGEYGEMDISASDAYVDDQPVRIALVQAADIIPRTGGSESINVPLNQGLAFVNGEEIFGKTASVRLSVNSRVKAGSITERTTWRGNLNIKMDVK